MPKVNKIVIKATTASEIKKGLTIFKWFNKMTVKQYLILTASK